ncbi:solute carrier organic anion transporter family member 3A1-like [Acanthaster planci]|uniref:Solute carrier organic anion transporter family member n=1 Tax=Acanthaster planci TaxID=133434 RepID=A0A8B7XRR2_ACAPL|nr:solute carrier organic anion transporter family member 3A1-like [Acanthaster planci]XP_022083537.1 solute carrier organic anion transporter family member 3A1-like [Acanthaster planci]XP_022083538.1 solute carrier organic anion transporter family member 3A1-like [Acanthaster planci]XP_022083539.1 solute carrier organic anion transporter family member 3A1-like [Acanthaster planci]XP_022083540.1 solute carrier organic anion transporter family member 3A1-like [Acanthaster planci]
MADRQQYTRAPQGADIEEGDQSETGKEKRGKYGCFSCHPSFLSCLATEKFFLLAMCALVFSDAFNIGTLGGALTSLETRYELTVSQLGLIESLYEAGNLIFALFVVHFAGREEHRRPMFIGLGGLTMALGTAIAYSPQFLFSPYQPDWRSLSTNHTSEPLTCGSDWPAQSSVDLCDLDDQHTLRQESHLAYVIVICGEILVGIGWTPVMPLSMSYIDDNVNAKSSAMFIGITQSMFGIGTIIGFLASAAVASHWVDFYRVDPDTIKLSPGDQLWVGAWWLGLAITSALYFVSSLPFFGFPRILRTGPSASDAKADNFMLENSTTSPDSTDTETEIVEPAQKPKRPSSLAALPKLVWRMLCNPVYVWLNIASFSEMAVVAGMVTFFPKYLETQFGLSPPEANFFMGVIPVPAVALGSVLGGYLLKKLSLKADGAMKLALACSVVSLVGQVVLFGVGCDSVGLAGVDVSYSEDPWNRIDLTVNLTSSCNVDCGCNLTSPDVVCGVDSITYFSPCHAGCKETINGTYFNCSCVQEPTNQNAESEPGSAQHGACPMSNCQMLAPFLAITFIIALFSSCEEIPQLLVMMRCVEKSDKSLALGVRHILFRVFGSIPAPLYYGVAIDATCRLWQQFCGEQGDCWAYSLPDFRFTYIGITVGLKALSTAAYVVAWVLLKRRSGTDMAPAGGEGTMVVGDTTTAYRKVSENGANGDALLDRQGESATENSEMAVQQIPGNESSV